MSVGESGWTVPMLRLAADSLFFFSDFSNILTKAKIERLAEVDEYEVVREVQVCYRDTD